MVCFYHPGRPAVGVCKHCGRGLCAGCAAEVGESLACRNWHEQQVRDLDTLQQRNILQAKRIGSNYGRNALFYFLSGLAFTIFGLYEIRWAGLQGVFLLLIGLFLLYACAANFMEGRKFKS